MLSKQFSHCLCIDIKDRVERGNKANVRGNYAPQFSPFKLGRSTAFPYPSQVNMNNSAAATSLQSCPTLCDPIDGSPPGSPVPGILQARPPEWAAISSSNV